MLAFDSTAITTSLVGAIALIASTLGVAVVSLRNSNRAHSEAQAGRADIKEQLSPGNGYGSLGDAIEALDKKVTETREQVGTNTGVIKQINDRLHDGDQRFAIIESKLSEVLAITGEARGIARLNAEKLDRHMDLAEPTIERAAPLLARAEREWGPDGKKRRR